MNTHDARMRVLHLGNTANNAYHNVLLLDRLAGIPSELPIRMLGLKHAISAPAWESLDFEVPDAEWVPHPDWSTVPGAVEFNREFSDLQSSAAALLGDVPHPGRGIPARLLSTARAVLAPLHGRRWAQPVFDISYSLVLARRRALAEETGRIDLLYGANSLIRLRVPSPAARLVCLEHGTVRWIADGGRETAVFRRAYREQVQRAQQLWVTNLDPRTLEIAEDVAPGRWSALPHPFVPDPRVPFIESEQHRRSLLEQTRSQALILLPSSQNWSKHHDKGSQKALAAFVELRRRGVEVGLVAVEWGLQLRESKEFLAREGLEGNVAWVAPMARFGLQRMMADVDVVWDQFGLDAFGALALRAVEQGTPLVSRGLTPAGERLIGGSVPWYHAAAVDEIVTITSAVLDDVSRRGREPVIAETRGRYRAWLLERHSPKLTALLQAELYGRLVDGTFERGTAAPDRWARLLAEWAGERR